MNCIKELTEKDISLVSGGVNVVALLKKVAGGIYYVYDETCCFIEYFLESRIVKIAYSLLDFVSKTKVGIESARWIREGCKDKVVGEETKK